MDRPVFDYTNAKTGRFYVYQYRYIKSNGDSLDAERVSLFNIRVTACGSSSAVECLLAKEEVASSNLVFRSIQTMLSLIEK
jgi:hypothetical protein